MPEVFAATNKKDKAEKKVVHRHVDEYSEVLRAERPCSNHLASFLAKPLAITFDAQDAGEHILLLLRQHPIVLVKRFFIILVLLLVPSLFAGIDLLAFLPGNFQFAALTLWYLMILGFTLETFLSWFFSVYIITDERVIDVDFISLIYKNVSAAKIDNIEDVTAITGGVLQSIFNYGTVKIQTAAADTEIAFESIPQPSKVTRLLNELILEEEKEKIEGRVR